MTYDLGPIFDDNDLPPGSQARQLFLAHVALNPWPPLAKKVHPEELLESAGEYDDDWSEFHHTCWNGAPTPEDPAAAKVWMAWGEQEKIRITIP